jgi:hypothetical protein
MLKKLLKPSLFVASLIIIWLVVMSLYQGLSGPWNSGDANSDWETISHPLYNFSIEYPTKWRLETYGEYGFKGVRDLKVWIYRSMSDSFRVDVRYRSKDSPSLKEVIQWSNESIDQFKSRPSHIEGYYQELDFYEDLVHETPVARRIYIMSGLQIEEVYFALDNDMVIISLRSPITEFDSYKDDFERIVESFSPTE